MKQSASISNTIFSKTQICCFQECIRSTFFSILAKIKYPEWTLGSLNHPHEHGFTDKCPDTRVFQIALRSGGKSPPMGGRIENFVEGNFVVGCWEPEEELF